MAVDTFDSRDLRDVAVAGGPTLRTILFGDDPRAAVPRRGWAAFRDTLSHVRPEMRTVVERELAAAVAGLLDIDINEPLLAGWRAHSQLREAARNTAFDRAATQIVSLAAHRIDSSYQPRVDLFVDEVRVATVEVTIDLTVEVFGLLATVRGGRLVALHRGRCVAHLALLFANTELLGGTAEFDAPVTIALGSGVDLMFAI